MEDKDKGSERSDNTIESGAPGNTTEEERLADLAESIHINPPAMTTMTEQTRTVEERPAFLRREVTNEIDPHMGH